MASEAAFYFLRKAARRRVARTALSRRAWRAAWSAARMPQSRRIRPPSRRAVPVPEATGNRKPPTGNTTGLVNQWLARLVPVFPLFPVQNTRTRNFSASGADCAPPSPVDNMNRQSTLCVTRLRRRMLKNAAARASACCHSGIGVAACGQPDKTNAGNGRYVTYVDKNGALFYVK